MSEIYKVYMTADSPVRVESLEKGDAIIFETNKPYKIGERFDKYPNLIVDKVFYEPKKWYQFWKKDIVVGIRLIRI